MLINVPIPKRDMEKYLCIT